MSEKRRTTTGSAHAERPGDDLFQESDGLTPEEAERLRPLVSQLQDTMTPVEPSAAFVRRLGEELREAARRQQTASRRFRRVVVISAAALGSLISVLGVVTLLLRRRRTHASTQAASG
jgi:hypothetical protein